jgi:hypothetical protein
MLRLHTLRGVWVLDSPARDRHRQWCAGS